MAARSNAPAFSQSNNSSAVVGIWQTSDGLVFQFDQSGGGDSFTSMVLNDSWTRRTPDGVRDRDRYEQLDEHHLERDHVRMLAR